MKAFPTSDGVAREKSHEQREKIGCTAFSSALPPLSVFVVLSIQVAHEMRTRTPIALYRCERRSGEIDAQLHQIVPAQVERDGIALRGCLHLLGTESIEEHGALRIADAAQL